MIQVAPHFTLEEFLVSDTATAQGIDNTPSAETIVRLTTLAAVMTAVRRICGRNPVLISSGYRCPELNAAIGGAPNSAHMYGLACDFTIPAFGSPLDICMTLQSRMKELWIDQLIHENNAWVHLGLANPPWDDPGYECLTINGGNTSWGFV